jgi:hypothetical protein
MSPAAIASQQELGTILRTKVFLGVKLTPSEQAQYDNFKSKADQPLTGTTPTHIFVVDSVSTTPNSTAANEIANKTKVSKRQQILDYIASHPGCMAEDVLAAFPAWRYSTVTARISEMADAGEIERVGTGSTVYSGSPAARWMISRVGVTA